MTLQNELWWRRLKQDNETEENETAVAAKGALQSSYNWNKRFVNNGYIYDMRIVNKSMKLIFRTIEPPSGMQYNGT